MNKILTLEDVLSEVAIDDLDVFEKHSRREEDGSIGGYFGERSTSCCVIQSLESRICMTSRTMDNFRITWVCPKFKVLPHLHM